MKSARHSTGQTLRTWRHGAGLSQRSAAQQLGFSQDHLSRIERGWRFPNTLEFADMVEAYEPSLCEIGSFLTRLSQYG